jgi:hypothetical protein
MVLKKKKIVNKWIVHVMTVKKNNPKLTFAEVLKKASKTYVKV